MYLLLIFIFLLILLILSAILLSYSIKQILTKNEIKGGCEKLTPYSLYTILENEVDTPIAFYKDNTDLKILLNAQLEKFSNKKIKCFSYGSGINLIKNTYNIFNLLQALKTLDNVAIILVGNMLAIKTTEAIDLKILETQMPNMKLAHNDNLTYLLMDDSDPNNSLILELAKLLNLTNLGSISIMNKLMDMFTSNALNISGGAPKEYKIELNDNFLDKFSLVIEQKYDKQIDEETAELLPYIEKGSVYNEFITKLIESNRNVEFITERPHTEKMKPDILYFLPKKNIDKNAAKKIFLEIGNDGVSTNAPSGEYFMGSAQNSFIVE